MKFKIPSPFARPIEGLRIKEGTPPISRPTREEAEQFPLEAKELIDSTWAVQSSLIRAKKYDLKWLENRHVILAGATGQGLGGAVAAAVLNSLSQSGSLIVVSRDLTRSLNFATGVYMQERAKRIGVDNRFIWTNEGLSLEGKGFEIIEEMLTKFGAKEVVYINTVASASSGLLPDFPSVYVKDLDEEGLFQWKLMPLTERTIQATKYFMGELAVQFPDILEKSGFHVEVSGFADWRGSLDRCSRNPAIPEYGRHGPYSTSLYLPKDIIQHATSRAYHTDKMIIDFFFPVMKTRSLSLIPGGPLMGKVFENLRNREGLPFVDIPELALAMLDRMGTSLQRGVDDPFPRLDMLEASLEVWYYEIMARLTNDENSDFYYKNWINPEVGYKDVRFVKNPLI